MSFTSYAQNFEDVMLWRALKHVEKGCYVDVGAQHPIIDSVSKAFYDHGWRGVHIEPVPEYTKLLRQDRPDETVLEVALSDSEGTLELNVIPETGLSTAVNDYVQRHQSERGFDCQRITVPVLTLTSALQSLAGKDVHWLKIDVEGLEGQVLKGWDSKTLRPWVMVIEATVPNSSELDYLSWDPILVAADYRFVYFDGLNRFYVAKEHAEIIDAFSVPPNVFDDLRLTANSAVCKEVVAFYQQRECELSAQAQACIAEVEARAGRAEVRANQEEVRANQAEAQASQAQARAKHAEAGLVLAQTELADLHNSTSWRITAPIRKGKLLIKQALVSLKSIVLLRQMLRSALLLVLVCARAIPPLKWLIENLAAYLPSVNSRLREFAHEHRVIPQQAASAEFVQQPNQLPPIAGFSCVEQNNDELHHALPKGRRIIYFYVDHTVSCPVNTGMQRVVRGLSRSLIESGERLCFVKWNFEYRQLVMIDRDQLAKLANWYGPELTPEEAARYPAADAAGIAVPAHQVGEANWLVVPEVPYINNHPAAVTLDVIMAAKQLGLKSAFVFYDATPLRRKELADIAPKHEEYMQQLLLADLLVPISEWSASDLAAFFIHQQSATQNTIPKIVALALTGESRLAAKVTEISQATRQLILSVGSITPHKNQLALVRAFAAFTDRHPDSGWELALVGNIHHDVATELAGFTARKPSIKVLNNVPDEELNRLISECAFTVFPSVMEGFGLPILESLWYGKPCVCADFGAMAEVAAGGGCLMVDVHNTEAILSAIERLAFEPETYSQLSEEALTRPLATWSDYAQAFAESLDQVSNPLNKIGLVYYCIDHTASYHANSGIQRVVRGLARALIYVGVNLVPVKWDREAGIFCRPTEQDLLHLARWNGPSVDTWAPWQDPAEASLTDWLLMPELLVDPSGPTGATVKRYATEHRLRTAWVFYDAIPWKMRDIYSQAEAERHAEYMRGLNEFELVLSISKFSRNDLIRFLRSIADRTPNLEDRVRACVLPGEFKESARVLQIRPTQDDTPIRILCVCTVEPRKNHLALLEAYKQLTASSDKKLELCLAGGAPFSALAEQVQHYIDTVPGIRWERSADDARLRELYDQCDFTVYPSLEEGFGLPILESLWHARPCICRDSAAMAEVGRDGGCLMVETADADALSAAMMQLVDDTDLRETLAQQAVQRPFRTWDDYANDVVLMMANERHLPGRQTLPQLPTAEQFRQEAINISSQPLLSICISTYNRAEWLALSLRNLERLLPVALDDVEIVVCDNTSTDNTPDAVKPYLGRSDFRYYRNPRNVGMLGNLQVTAHHARGRYVWILGDDDLVVPGSIQRILTVLREQQDLALVYLNYAYTREDDATSVADIDHFLVQGTPIVTPGPNIYGPVRRISTESENFFTAIYCLVFRRDHALQAYSQNTEGRTFSTMLTSIPTTYYVLHRMMDEPACWIGEPQLVINMNVSWLKYASLWILERLPEVFDYAEVLGADPASVDHWREHNLKSVEHFFSEIFENDPCGNIEYFSPARLIARFKHLEAFKQAVPNLMAVYEAAHLRGLKGAELPTAEIFAAFQKN